MRPCDVRGAFLMEQGATMQQKSMLAAGMAAAAVMTFAGMALAQSPDPESQSFIKTAIQGNISEIDVGKLAQKRVRTLPSSSTAQCWLRIIRPRIRKQRK